MRSLLAGWVAGYVVAVVMTMALTLVLAGARRQGAAVFERLPARLSPWMFAVLVSIGAMLGWTLVGVVLGGVYHAAARGAAPGLGSPALAFTAAVAGGAVVLGLAAMLWARSLAWAAGGTALAACAAFGWLLPNLAEG